MKVYIVGIADRGGLWFTDHKCYASEERALEVVKKALVEDPMIPTMVFDLYVEGAEEGE